MCRERNIETPEGVIPQIARGFGGGIGNTGSVCGGVAGGVMAIGLARGPGETMEEALQEFEIPGELRRRFEAEMGALECRALTGADLSTKAGVEGFMASDIPVRVCHRAVRTAYRLALELLDEASSEAPKPDGAD